MKLECERTELALVSPMSAAHGEVDRRVLLQVQLTGEDGAVGYGEAAPLPGYDGSDTGAVEAALRGYEPVLAAAEREGMNGPAVIEACRAVADIPQALAAIDLALWDRAGRREGRPLAAMLTDVPAATVPVNATLTALDRAGVAAQAHDACAAGFRCVKVKVGIGDDAGRVAAARAGAGPALDLRLDANGAWGVEEAVRAIDALAPAGLELVEEPTRGLRAVREVRERVPVRVSIDETAGEPGALGAGVADAVCLKVSRCGGVAALLAAATLVRAAGAEVYLASTLDGPLGIAAALHAAAALASRGPLPCCGLATLALFDGVADPLPARDGEIALPPGPGLGVEPL
ncbi:MAG TPA: mandelate racemase/muconate lactonizing enzyme family protein [Solirubrobacteraceae bacterium]|nr:mandelate racemase/muconate lactonizing enzyme family protein [Solirubrobacteraceae bacterium]